MDSISREHVSLPILIPVISQSEYGSSVLTGFSGSYNISPFDLLRMTFIFNNPYPFQLILCHLAFFLPSKHLTGHIDQLIEQLCFRCFFNLFIRFRSVSIQITGLSFLRIPFIPDNISGPNPSASIFKKSRL